RTGRAPALRAEPPRPRPTATRHGCGPCRCSPPPRPRVAERAPTRPPPRRRPRDPPGPSPSARGYDTPAAPLDLPVMTGRRSARVVVLGSRDDVAELVDDQQVAAHLTGPERGPAHHVARDGRRDELEDR